MIGTSTLHTFIPESRRPLESRRWTAAEWTRETRREIPQGEYLLPAVPVTRTRVSLPHRRRSYLDEPGL